MNKIIKSAFIVMIALVAVIAVGGTSTAFAGVGTEGTTNGARVYKYKDHWDVETFAFDLYLHDVINDTSAGNSGNINFVENGRFYVEYRIVGGTAYREERTNHYRSLSKGGWLHLYDNRYVAIVEVPVNGYSCFYKLNYMVVGGRLVHDYYESYCVY